MAKACSSRGPNGSGKSSLTAAIIWALTGERPRDQGEITPDEVRPVFGSDDKPVGDWSPLATYPLTAAGLTQKPNVRVEVVFTTSSGVTASAARTYDGTPSKPLIDPALQIPPILLEAGLLMPSRLPRLRLDEGKGQLTDAVQKLTGLDDLIELGAFVQNLCHATREYRAYKPNELKLATSQFEQHVERARSALAPVSIAVPVFKPSDTDAKDGAFALLGKKLNDDAAELTKVVSDDLASASISPVLKSRNRSERLSSEPRRMWLQGWEGYPPGSSFARSGTHLTRQSASNCGMRLSRRSKRSPSRARSTTKSKLTQGIG